MGAPPAAKDLELACKGDDDARSRLFAAHAPGLVRYVDLRLDARLRRRLDPADVAQQALLEAAQRFVTWCRTCEPPFRIWLRLLTAQALAAARRRNLGAQRRDAAREHDSAHLTNSQSVAHFLAASQTSPSGAAVRNELAALVARALDELEDVDREVLVLRQFEHLSNEETARELGIEPAAASKRFVRALARLRPALEPFGLLA